MAITPSTAPSAKPTSPPSPRTSAPPPSNSASRPTNSTSRPPPPTAVSPPLSPRPPPLSPSKSPPPQVSPSPPPPTAAPPPGEPPPLAKPPPSPRPPSSSPPPPPPKDNTPSPPSERPPPPPRPPESVPVPPSSPLKHSPPPPHSKGLAPPRREPGGKSGRESPPKEEKKGSSVNHATIVGVAVGVGLFFVLVAVSAAVICCSKKKKKKRRNPANTLHYHDATHQVPPPKWQRNAADHVVKLPLPPGAHGPNWQIPPPGAHDPSWQTPPPTLSGEVSSGFSSSTGPTLQPSAPGALALGFNKSTFSLDELVAATGSFSANNLLGQGGFGYVHKGVLPNGKEVAVKQLKSGSGQGEREFQAEVEIISRVHHRHLVSLVGYCIAGTQRMLVYEFVPNKTLEYHLHVKGMPVMDWPTRLKIALGSAKGLAYLHEDCHPRIIHRDIKSANILLDYKFEAMVADFGLAKLSSDNHTHVSTRVMGTFGYLAPEYASSGKLTEKSDVFSFGVMLLELITGRRPVDPSNVTEDSLVDWARPVMTQGLADGNFHQLVDRRLDNNYNAVEMTRVVACAAASVRHSARRRPKMSQIVRALEGDVSLDDLSEENRQGQNSMLGSGSDYDSGSYASNMSHFRRVALGSSAHSGEYSGMTSEYGLNPSSSSSEGFFSDIRPVGPSSHRPQTSR